MCTEQSGCCGYVRKEEEEEEEVGRKREGIQS